MAAPMNSIALTGRSECGNAHNCKRVCALIERCPCGPPFFFSITSCMDSRPQIAEHEKASKGVSYVAMTQSALEVSHRRPLEGSDLQPLEDSHLLHQCRVCGPMRSVKLVVAGRVCE